MDKLIALQKRAELTGNQHEIDANDNGKIDEEDFELLRSNAPEEERKEEDEQQEKSAAQFPGLWWDKLGKDKGNSYESPSPAEEKSSILADAVTSKTEPDGSINYGEHKNLRVMQGHHGGMAGGPPSTKTKAKAKAKGKPAGPIGEFLLAKLRGKKKQ
jgi:hypothetical protein